MLEPRPHVGSGLVAEHLPRLLDGRTAPGGPVPAPLGFEHDAGVVAGDLVDHPCEVDDPGLSAGGEVERLSHGLLEGSEPEGAIHDVADVGEVPGLLASPRYG